MLWRPVAAVCCLERVEHLGADEREMRMSVLMRSASVAAGMIALLGTVAAAPNATASEATDSARVCQRAERYGNGVVVYNDCNYRIVVKVRWTNPDWTSGCYPIRALGDRYFGKPGPNSRYYAAWQC